MPLTAEEKFRMRARKALEQGESFVARGAKNLVMLEEVRAEIAADVAAGRKSVQSATSAGKKKVDAAGAVWVDRIEQAGEEAVRKVKRAKKEKSARGSSDALPAETPSETHSDLQNALRMDVDTATQSTPAEEVVPSELPSELPNELPSELPSELPMEVDTAGEAAEEDTAGEPPKETEFAPPLREEDAAKLIRLKYLTFQIQALDAILAKNYEGVHVFVRDKLEDERKKLLRGWRAGLDYVDALEHEDRLSSCTDYQAQCGYENYKAPLALLDGRVSALAALKQEEEVHRQDFETAKGKALDDMAELQKLALEVRAQEAEAHKARTALHYHKGFQAAREAFADMCLVLKNDKFITHHYIRECQNRSGLEACDLGHARVDLGYHTPQRPVAEVVDMPDMKSDWCA